MLSHSNNDQQQSNSNENSTPSLNRKQHNTRLNNRTRSVTALSPLVTHTNRACGFQHMLHSMPENNIYSGNSLLTNHTYQEFHKRRHNYHMPPFRHITYRS